LTTVHDCRRLLARCIKQYNAGEISEAKLRTMSYAIDKLAKLIESSDHEERLNEIEKQLEEIEKEEKEA